MQSVAGVLVGVTPHNHACEPDEEEGSHARADATGHGWVPPRWLRTAADQMMCPC